DWRYRALKDLRDTLVRESFPPETLQRAHEARYRRPLVDLISMVKHAVKEESPLLTAPERVDAALAKVTAGRTLAADQKAWLDHIRGHLVENLSIEEADFDDELGLSRH